MDNFFSINAVLPIIPSHLFLLPDLVCWHLVIMYHTVNFKPLFNNLTTILITIIVVNVGGGGGGGGVIPLVVVKVYLCTP
jgi:hypothetical protein